MTVSIDIELAKLMLEDTWFSQWETRNAAENIVCAHGCSPQFQDFVSHAPACAFVAKWERLAEVRRVVGDTHKVEVRRAAPSGGDELTRDEYEERVRQARAAPGWLPKGDPNCSDCCCMSHCETHHKLEGEYPEGWISTPARGTE